MYFQLKKVINQITYYTYQIHIAERCMKVGSIEMLPGFRSKARWFKSTRGIHIRQSLDRWRDVSFSRKFSRRAELAAGRGAIVPRIYQGPLKDPEYTYKYILGTIPELKHENIGINLSNLGTGYPSKSAALCASKATSSSKKKSVTASSRSTRRTMAVLYR